MSCCFSPLWQKPVVGKIARLVDVLVVVGVFGLDRVGRQKHCGLRRTIILIVQNGLLHLRKERNMELREQTLHCTSLLQNRTF